MIIWGFSLPWTSQASHTKRSAMPTWLHGVFCWKGISSLAGWQLKSPLGHFSKKYFSINQFQMLVVCVGMWSVWKWMISLSIYPSFFNMHIQCSVHPPFNPIHLFFFGQQEVYVLLFQKKHCSVLLHYCVYVIVVLTLCKIIWIFSPSWYLYALLHEPLFNTEINTVLKFYLMLLSLFTFVEIYTKFYKQSLL